MTGQSGALWTCSFPEIPPLSLAAPVIGINGGEVCLISRSFREVSRTTLPDGSLRQHWRGAVESHLPLELEICVHSLPDAPFIRFKYILHATSPVHLTNDASGRNALSYFRVALDQWPRATEVRLGVFSQLIHSFTLEEIPVPPAAFEAGLSFVGPLVVASNGTSSLLIGYEHGSQSTNRYLEFRPASDRSVELVAVKGNYLNRRIVEPGAPFETIWFQLGAVDGNETMLAAAYRDFIRRRQTSHEATRRPRIFYNTWNHQERLKNWQNRSYLSEMNQDRLLAEIEVAHQLGIEVFVIDTGWYSKAGDWTVDLTRFPDGLLAVRKALAERGMQLGLWFNPTIAALTSRMHRQHRDCIQEWKGEAHAPHAHWEGEPSQGLCLVSHYADAYAEELIRLVRELGVTYFKWDAVSQDGPWSCDAANHNHGDSSHSREERNDCYGFEQVRAMIRIIERVQEVCPEAVFDFDITESGRAVGLGFLSVGRFFLVNNGPYRSDYDLPSEPGDNANLFFHHGPARTWICRSTLGYDKWIPSGLFLTHYFPDGPEDSQIVNAASLLLGHNGLWGDLLAMNERDVLRWKTWLCHYKQVRDSVAAANPFRVGAVGGDPEIHEKIAGDGRGVVVVFANGPGVHDYLTNARNTAMACPATSGIEVVRILPDGRAHLRARFDKPGARIVLFGVRDDGHEV